MITMVMQERRFREKDNPFTKGDVTRGVASFQVDFEYMTEYVLKKGQYALHTLYPPKNNLCGWVYLVLVHKCAPPHLRHSESCKTLKS